MDEENIWLESARQGDKTAFGKLIVAYQSPIYNLAYRMLDNANEAEEAAQETFIRAYTRLHTFDPDRPFSSWLFTIANNHCIDILRKRRYLLLSLEDRLPPHQALMTEDGKGPEAQVISGESQQLVQGLLQVLAPDLRQAIIMRYWQDMSLEEIAEVMGATVSAIKSRLFRARRRLAQVGAARGLGPAAETDQIDWCSQAKETGEHSLAQPAIQH